MTRRPRRSAESRKADLNPPGVPGPGERIRIARQAMELTQEGLAREVGVSRSAVAQWETDRSGQVGGNLARIASILGVAVEYLLTGAGPREGPGATENATELGLLRLYRACSEEDRAMLMRLAVRLSRLRSAIPGVTDKYGVKYQD